MSTASRSVAFVACVFFVGCSSAPNTDAAAGDAVAATDVAVNNEVLTSFDFGVYSVCTTDGPASGCQSNVQLVVFGPALRQIPDAVVTVNDQPVPHVGD